MELMTTPEQRLVFRTTTLVMQYAVQVASIQHTYTQHSASLPDEDNRVHCFFCPVFAHLVAIGDPSTTEDLGAVLTRAAGAAVPDPVRAHVDAPCECAVCTSINATDPAAFVPSSPFERLLSTYVRSASERVVGVDPPTDADAAKKIFYSEVDAIIELVQQHYAALQ